MELNCLHGADAHSICMTKKCGNSGALVCIEQEQCKECVEQHRNCALKGLQQVREEAEEEASKGGLSDMLMAWSAKCVYNVAEGLERLGDSLEERRKIAKQQRLEQRLESLLVSSRKGGALKGLKGLLLWVVVLSSLMLLCSKVFVAPAQEIVTALNVTAQNSQSCPVVEEIIEQKEEVEKEVGSEEVKTTLEQPPSGPAFCLDSHLTNDTDLIASFFPLRKIKSARLLFRASQHSFLTELFHHYCDNKPNVLLLVHNQFDRVLGAYSPLPFKSDIGFEHTADHSGTTFLFSITNRQKYPLLLQQKPNALYNDEEWGPSYGMGCDLRISNEANKNKRSYSRFPQSFYNPAQREPSVARYQFTGSVFDQGFRLKEWEVFQLQFAE